LAFCIVLALPVQAQPEGTAAPQARATPPSEPDACRQPFGAGATGAAPASLRAIAGHCHDPVVTRLLANRAEHAEQLRRLGLMSRLLRRGSNTDRTRHTQCRLYTGLAEAFAERMQRERPAARSAALEQLNLAYEQAIHIAERTLAGYERIVGIPAAPR
jgi:hypothetical protein